MEKIVYDFLKNNAMLSSEIDMEKSMFDFIDEMEKGLSGEKSSLMMIPTYLSIKETVPLNQKIIVIDAGGTNFRVAVVYFNNDKEIITSYFQKYSMPGSNGTISKSEFFNTIVDRLMPIIDESNTIAFCFSYPTEILPNIDGKVISFSKEVSVEDMQGVIIGENIREVLKNRGVESDKKVILLNDTVAAMLGAIAVSNNKKFDGFMGFILGTGTNSCYVEKSGNITKCGSLKENSIAINLESGNFSKFPRGTIDLEFDKTTKNCGSFTFEKMISGAYQSTLIYMTIAKAVEESLFTDTFKQNFEKINDITMRNIDDFCYFPFGDNVLSNLSDNETDKKRLYEIIDCSFERSAKMVCVNISAILYKTGLGKSPIKPLCISADGTTFYKSPLFKCKLDYYIKNFTNDKLGLYCTFVKVDNAPIIGSAVAGLFNK